MAPAASAHPIIFALACSADRSGLHIHRISGPGCFASICAALESMPPRAGYNQSGTLAPTSQKTRPFTAQMIKPRHAHYLQFVAASGATIDDVVVTFYKGPASYTGEDSCEITAHGNPLIAAQIHSRLRELGFSDAKPGEFTQRAYLNGKLDLTQAEAVAALIEADTAGGLELARASSQGSIQREVSEIRTSLVSLRAQLEARIDFSEDEVGAPPWPLIASLCGGVIKQLQTLEASYERGKKIREGLRISLAGAPNAGKSSLYNALLAEDAAIVSEEMGTTRDVLRERFFIKGRDFILSDTAGIRSSHETTGAIEQQGIERTFREMKQAAVVLAVFDLAKYSEERSGTALLQDLDQLTGQLGLTNSQQVLLVLNKTDLVPLPIARSMQKFCCERNIVTICCNKDDIFELEEALCQAYDRSFDLAKNDTRAGAPEGATLISTRQRDQVRRALRHIQHAASLCQEQAYLEILASEVIGCEEALIDLLGRVDIGEVFQEIFTNFCIGK